MNRTVGMLLCGLLLSLGISAEVANPDQPAKGQWKTNQKLLWQTDSAGNDLIGSIQNVLLTQDDRVVILDSKESAVHVFSSDGTHQVRFGKRGEGPGEFKTLNRGRQVFSIGKQIIFYDVTRLQRFDIGGTFLGQTTIPGRLDPVAFVDEDRFISAPATSDDPKAEIAVELFDMKKNESKLITRFKPYDKATASERSGRQAITVAIVISDITPLMTAAANQKHIVIGKSDRYRLSLLDLEGKELVSFSIPERKAKTVGTEYRENMKKRITGNAPVEMVQRIIDGLPNNASFFSGLQILENDMILAFVSDPDRNDGFSVDIFSPKGQFLYRADFRAPDGHTIDNYAINAKRLILATQDEDGIPTLSCYQISLPAQ